MRERVRTPLLLAAAAALLLAAPAARAAGPAAPAPAGAAVTIDELVAAAREESPAVAAARADVDAALAGSRVVSSYPDPTLTGTWWPENAGDGKPATWEVMLEQGLPFPGKLGAVDKVRRTDEAVARINLERAVRDVGLQVRESATEIHYLREAQRIAAGNRELLARLRAAGESGYAAGRAGLFDALRAQAQQSQTQYDEGLLAELEQTEVARLNSLLNRPADAPLGPVDLRAGRPLAATPGEVSRLAAERRLEVVLAREEGSKAREESRLAGLESRPELMLGVGAMRENALGDMAATTQWELKLGVSLPLFGRKNSGRVSQAGANAARAAAAESAAAAATRAEVNETLFRLRTAERLVGLYRDALVPQALVSLQLADVWYRGGQGSLADLVEAGTLWYTFQLALARAGADREKYLARLEALAGGPLTRDDGQPAAAAPADEAAWRRELARIADDRAAREQAAAAPLGETGLLAPDARRAAELAPAAQDAAAAAAALFPRVALGDLEILALLRSPLVRSAERSARAALEQYGQVTALDDVVRRYASAGGSLMTGLGGTMNAGTAALFPFPGVLALKGEIVARDADAAREELSRARRDALAEARRLWWALEFAHRGEVLLGEIRELRRQGVDAVRAAYQSGKGAIGDLTAAEAELEKVANELQGVVEERGVLESQVRALLALPRDARVGAPDGGEARPVAADFAALAPQALARRQELRRMRAMAERMELMIQMGEREVVPGFALEASLFQNQPLLQDGTAAMRRPFENDAPAADGVGTPRLPFSGRATAYLRETRERLAALRDEIRAEEQATLARLQEACFALTRARREERLYGVRIAELTRVASESRQGAYRAGRAELPGVLDANRESREAALEAARRRMQVGQAAAALEAAVGGAPEPVAGGGGT